MEWINLFSPDRQPSEQQIAAYIDNPLWARLNYFLQKSYGVQPVYSYSACSGQPGWNVKYQKSGRSLCTLYPMSGHFIALVVVGAKEQAGVEQLAPTFTPHVRALLDQAAVAAGARWLMISVTDAAVLEDVKQLIQLRRSIKGRTS